MGSASAGLDPTPPATESGGRRNDTTTLWAIVHVVVSHLGAERPE